MKNVFKFLIFENKVKKLESNTPSMEKFRAHLRSSFYSYSDVNLRGKPHQIKKILPLKSLVFTHVWTSLNEVYVRFDRDEFNQVVDNKVNKELLAFIGKYQTEKMSLRYRYFLDNQETIRLLIDALNCEYHFDNEKDVIELLKYLMSEIKGVQFSRDNKDNIKARMEIELEFIKRRKEVQSFDFK